MNAPIFPRFEASDFSVDMKNRREFAQALNHVRFYEHRIEGVIESLEFALDRLKATRAPAPTPEKKIVKKKGPSKAAQKLAAASAEAPATKPQDESPEAVVDALAGSEE